RGMRRPPLRMLIVEDDARTIATLVGVCRADGFGVEVERGGVFLIDRVCDALTVVGDDRPDLVVARMRMPGAYGLEIANAVRRFTARVPIVLLDWRRDDVEARAEAARLGAIVVDAPVTATSVREVIH